MKRPTGKRLSKSDKYPIVLQRLPPPWVSEYKFHPVRKWRFDFANPELKIAIEVDGGVWTGGRHSGGAGQIGDMEKGNAAIVLGWRVLHYTPDQIRKQAIWIDDVAAILPLSDKIPT